MRLKSLDEIKKYMPEDGLCHDIQIIGEFIYVDGDCQNPYAEFLEGEIKDVKFQTHTITAEEIKSQISNYY